MRNLLPWDTQSQRHKCLEHFKFSHESGLLLAGDISRIEGFWRNIFNLCFCSNYKFENHSFLLLSSVMISDWPLPGKQCYYPKMTLRIRLEQVVILSFEIDYWPLIGNQKIPTFLLEFYVLFHVSFCTWAKRPQHFLSIRYLHRQARYWMPSDICCTR